MRLKSSIGLVFVTLFLAAAPAWPKFGITKTRARFAMYHPPAFHAYGRQLRVEVNSVDPVTGFMMGPLIQHLLEEALARQNLEVTPNSRTLLQCTLTDSAVLVSTATRSESVNVHVGERAQEEKDGTTRQVEDCQVQTMPVTYLTSTGHLAMEVRARDAQTEAAVMSRLVERSYRQESAIAGPPRCRGEAYTLRAQLHNPIAILSQLGDAVVAAVLPLAVGYDEVREVLLAVDDELKPGNAQALAGAWADALDTWTRASARSRTAEAARQYNIGVAHEVLAAAAMRNWGLTDAASHLHESHECYAEALRLDPKEKYFRDTMARVEVDRQLLRRQLEQASQEETARSAAPPRGAARDRASSATGSSESWPAGENASVHEFRVYVRTRMSAQKGRPMGPLREQLLASAADYRVASEVAVQVVDSESQRLAMVRQSMEKYRLDFQAAVADGVISEDEREMLRRRRQILRVSDADAKEIESQFRFQEGG